MNRSWDLSIYTYAGRAKAPEPRAIAEPEEQSAAPVEPAATAETSTEDATAVEPAAVADEATTETDETSLDGEAQADVADTAETEDAETPTDGVTDTWTDLTAGLYTPEPAPSTVDELFAALQLKGIPA
jgi:hypothetical protein